MAKAKRKRTADRTGGLIQPPPIEPTRPATGFQRWFPPVFVYLASVAVYIPALDNGFVSWDDDHYIYDNRQLIHEKGLADIWTNIKHTRYKDVRDPKNGEVLKDSTHQYYPLLFTMFWIEHRIYGDDPSVFKPHMEARGYHATSIVLHGVNSVILLLLLQRLGLGVWASWLVASLFAVHPMNVASVAWAAERKNLLALFFYMLAMMSYLRFRRRGGWGFYAGTFVLFQCALWSKTVALTFPLVLLLTDRVIDRRWDMRSLVRIAPMFILSLIAAATTSYVEDRNRRVPLVAHQRPFVAAATVWFYPAKLLVPNDQMPIYNLWNPDAIDYDRWHPAGDPKWWLPIIGLAAAGWALFHWRRPITAQLGPQFWWGLGFYLITQFPMMGWKNINFFQFAYVADHYIYNGCAGIFVMTAVAVDALRRKAGARRLEPPLVTALVCAALGAYAVKTWRYSEIWQDSETFWGYTLARNRGCWPGWYNLGNLYKRQSDALAKKGEDAEANELLNKAVEHYQQAIEAKRNLHSAYSVMNSLLLKLDRHEELERYADQEIAVDPRIASPYYFKGVVRQEAGDYAEAVTLFKTALDKGLSTDMAPYAGTRMGVCLMRLEQWEEARRVFEFAVKRLPRQYDVRMNLGICHFKLEDWDEAEQQFREAQKLRPREKSPQTYLDEIKRRREGGQ